MKRLSFDGQHRFGAQDQSRPEHRMSEIGAGLIKRAEAVELGCWGASKAAQLGKMNHIQ